MEATVTYFPRESLQVLHNPYMGWVYIDNAVPRNVDAGRSVRFIRDGTAWGEVGNVAVLSTWGLLEPAEGEYDWTFIDQAIQYWTSQGKTIHLRISTDPMVIPLIGINVGVPQWLYDKGVPSMTREEVGVEIVYPDYTHPVYKHHLKAFLEALAEHIEQYTSIELIDLRGYGTWGEWHSGYDYDTLEERRAALRGVVDLWDDAFHPMMLSLSNSYEWREEIKPAGVSINHRRKPTFDEYIQASLFDEAFARTNVSLRRDGVAGYVFDEYDGRMIHEFFRIARRPITAEIAGGIEHFAGGGTAGYTPRRALDEALHFHPNYIMMMGWDLVGYDVTGNPRADSAMNFYNRESAGLMQDALRYMGYRLVIPFVRVPRAVAPGDDLTIEHHWENRALGRLYKPHQVTFFLVGDDETVWSGVADEVDVTQMISGEVYKYTSRFPLPKMLADGIYSLRVAVTSENAEANGGDPSVIDLAMEGRDAAGRYTIGNVKVSGQRTESSASAPKIAGTVTPGEDFIPVIDNPKLLPGGTYVFSFQYDVVRSPSPTIGVNGHFNAVFERESGDPEWARVGVTWTDETGMSGTKTGIVTLGHADDYSLHFRTEGDGEVNIDGVTLVLVDPERLSYESFDERIDAGKENSIVRVLNGAIRQTSQPLTGTGALRVHRSFNAFSGTQDEDHVFLETNDDVFTLKPATFYTVSFRFKQLSQKGFGSYFYVDLISADDEHDDQESKTLLRWLDDPWTRAETKTVSFMTPEVGTYKIAWGVHNGGSAIFDEITIIEGGLF